MINEKTEEFQHLELLGKYALFTNGRIDRSTVPRGLYCYDFLGSDDDPGELRYIEESVAVNHSVEGVTTEDNNNLYFGISIFFEKF